MQYAQTTEVSSDKSRAEIDRTLSRYGASGFMYGWQDDKAVIAFVMKGKKVRFDLPLPDKSLFTKTDTGRTRKENQQELAYEQAVRQRWRALALVIKAKLEAVETGITEFEEEFLAHIVLPNGETFGQRVIPQLNEIYTTGKMPKLLT